MVATDIVVASAPKRSLRLELRPITSSSLDSDSPSFDDCNLKNALALQEICKMDLELSSVVPTTDLPWRRCCGANGVNA